MATTTTASERRIGNKPAFVTALIGETPEARRARLDRVHSEYATNFKSWQVLLDAFEGTGGFLDGTYLWCYPREDESAFSKRQEMARYHNYVESLIDIYVRFMFTQGVKRSSTNADYDEWLLDVDGAGTGIDEFLRRLSALALASGHAGVLVDKTVDEATGPTKADDKGRIIAVQFTATAITDWRHTREVLTAVKLLEDAPSPGIADAVPDGAAQQYLIWDTAGWARFDSNGELVACDTLNLGLVPFVALRPKPRQLSRMVGRALVSNANIVRALFNRASEEDEVLRGQAFSLLTVEAEPESDVVSIKASLGGTIGSAKAIVVKGKIKYETPDQAVPGAIRDNIQYLVNEMYRAAHMRYQRDSLAAETAESIRLQYTELNEMLQGMSKALTACEQGMARAWCAWNSATPQAAEAMYQELDPQADYPDEFFLDDLLTELQAWAEAISMNLGPTMAKRIKKKAVRRVEPDMPPEELDKIDAEIDGMPDEQLLPTPTLLDPNAVDFKGKPVAKTPPQEAM